MKRNLEEAIIHRRTYYSIGSDSPVLDEEVVHAVRVAVKHLPSAFNSQGTRVVILFGEQHSKFWELVNQSLKAHLLTDEAYQQAKSHIDQCFAAGHGTILFYEDMDVVKGLQEKYPIYAGNFETWAQQTSAMHQFAIWTMLEDLGLGVSLQHYNPLVDERAQKEWNLPQSWKLIAQMPFGMPAGEPRPKEISDVSERIKIFL